MTTITSNQLAKYLTIELSSEDTEILYADHVWNWIGELVPIQAHSLFEKLLFHCFNIKISTLDAAKYIVDKYSSDIEAHKRIKVNFNKENFISSKTLFVEKNTENFFLLSAKMEGEYILLRANKRTRTHRGASPYEFRKIHLSNLNKDYTLFRY